MEDLSSQNEPLLSLDSPLKGQEDGITLGSLIPDPNSDQLMEEIDENLQEDDLYGSDRQDTGDWRSQLNEREKKIMRLRWGNNWENLSKKEIRLRTRFKEENNKMIERALLKFMQMNND